MRIFLITLYLAVTGPMAAAGIEELRRQQKYQQALKLAQQQDLPLQEARLYLDLEQFEKAIRLYQQHCTGQQVRCYNEWAISLMAIGEYSRARQHFVTALSKEPKRADLQSNLALCYLYLNQYKRAAQHHQLALKLAPGDDNVNLNYAAYLLKMKRVQPAREILEKLLKNNRPLFLAHLYMAISYVYSNDYHRAHDHLNKGIQINRYYFDLYYYRAKVRYKLGSKRGALLDLEMAENLKPGNTRVMPLKVLIKD